MSKYLKRMEAHLAHAKEALHHARKKDELDDKEAESVFKKVDHHLRNAANAARGSGHKKSEQVHDEIHQARDDLKEWRDTRDDDEPEEHHEHFEGLHHAIDAWMDDLRESGREW